MALEKLNPHRIALHAASHLTAFEEQTSPQALLVEEIRQQFITELGELSRKEYRPRLDKFTPQENNLSSSPPLPESKDWLPAAFIKCPPGVPG